jgi:hypothetical protein
LVSGVLVAALRLAHSHLPCCTEHTPPFDRYAQAEAVFRADARFDADGDHAMGGGGTGTASSSLTHTLDGDHSLQDLLLFYAAEKEPQAFVDAFDQLVAFVDASLDLYKVCLCLVSGAHGQQQHRVIRLTLPRPQHSSL